MRHVFFSRKPSVWQACTLCVLPMLCVGNAARAQTNSVSATNTMMHKPLRLLPDKVGEKNTLRTLLADINTQTGLHLEAENYLLDRDVMIAADGQSADSILRALTELNDWTLRDVGANRLRLTRPRYIAPANLSEVSKTIQRCLPADLRRYIGIGMQPKDIVLSEDSHYRGRETQVMKRSPELILSESNRYRISSALQQAQNTVAQTLDRQHFQKGDLAFKEWSQDSRSAVISWLVLETLKQEATPEGASLYLSALLPFQSDLSKSVLSVHGGIFISSYLPASPDHPKRITKVGFGVVIPEEDQRLRSQSQRQP